MKGIVIAGTHSGCGKTTISLGLMAALARRGLRVAPFKVGPDFIDPGHHFQVVRTVSRTLDGWMLPRAYNLRTFQNAALTADIAVVEGVMGLFDGYDGKTEAGSTAQMAKWLGLPVVLVVDARSMARSAAALVMGFESFDPQLRFAGVLFNNLGSRRHLAMLQEALPGSVRMPCLGGLLREEAVRIPERHLGLVTAGCGLGKVEDAPLIGPSETGFSVQLTALPDTLNADGVSQAVVREFPGARYFEVRAGEVLGIAGVQGNGQTELVEAITGLRPALGGRMIFSEKRWWSGLKTTLIRGAFWQSIWRTIISRSMVCRKKTSRRG